MANIILNNPLFMEIVLPFLLVFTVIFAILQRTKILGEGKARIDAITALVIALIVVAYGYSTHIITTLMPFLAVSAVIILIFMLLYGFIAAGKEGADFSKFKIPAGIIIVIALTIAVLVATGYWSTFIGWFTGNNSNAIVTNVVFIGIIIAAIAIVLGKKSGETKT